MDGARYDIISNWENALRSSHSARYAIGAGVDLQVRSGQILLQKSKIERLRNRDPPDDSRTGVNIGAFPAFLQDRRKVRTAIDTSRNRNGGRGADLLTTDPRNCSIKRRAKSSLRISSFDSPAGFAIAASLDPR